MSNARALTAILVATVLTLASARANPFEDGFGDLGVAGGGAFDGSAGAATASDPQAGGVDLDTRPRDELDALGRGLPTAGGDLEAWYLRWSGEYAEHADVTDPVVGGEKVFGGLFGEASWVASSNKAVVLSTLGMLTPPDGDPAREALLSAMLDALAARAASNRPAGGTSRQVDQASLRSRLGELARRPQGLGPGDADALRGLGVVVWDFKAAAFVLLAHLAPRRQAADDALLARLLENPPDPFDAGEGDDLLADLSRRARAGDEAARRRLEDAYRQAERWLEQRSDATRTLRRHLGETAMSSPALMAVAARRVITEADPSTSAAVRAALLELGRAEAALVEIEDSAPLPAAGEVSVGPDGQLFESFDAHSLGSRVREDLLDSDVSVRASLLDLELVPGVSLAAKYRWELEGDLQRQTWTRVDTWTLKGEVRAGDLLADVFDLPFSIDLDAEREILLVRSFDKPGEAARALPKTPLALPLTAEKARQMPSGWFFSLPVKLTAAARLTFGYAQGLIGADGFAHYLLRGRFRLNFFKESPTHVRVQLIGAHERGPGGGARVKMAVDVFGIRVLDRALTRALGLELLRYQYDRRRGVGIAADYVYDLSNGQAADAFEKAVRYSLGFGPALSTRPELSAQDMRDRLLVDLRPTERLFLEDRTRPEDQRRVDRRFLGTNTFRLRETTFRLGPRLARWGKNRRWIENDLRVVRPDGVVEGYEFPMFSVWSGWSLLFGIRKESRELQAFALMPRPERGGDPVGPQGLVLSAGFRDRRASRGELEELRAEVVRGLGPTLSSRMGLEAAPIPTGGKSLRSRLILALHPPATARLLDPSVTTAAVMQAAAQRTLAAYGRDPASSDAARRRAATLVEGLEMTQRVPGEPGSHRQVTALARLADVPTWRQLGPRFLVELVGDQLSTATVHAEVAWQAKGAEPFGASFGQAAHAEMYQVVSEALSAVADRDRPLESR